MTLGLYMARRLMAMLGLITAVFLGVLYLFELVEMVRRFGGAGSDMSQLVWLALLRVPRTLYQILPLIMILASMAVFLAMARTSELVVVRASGRSALRMMIEPLAAVFIAGALAVALFNPVVAMSTRLYHAQVQAMQDPETATQIALGDGEIWLRQGDEAGQTVIRAGRAGRDGLSFHEVSFLHFERATGRPVSRIEAAEARLGDGAWTLREARRWQLDADNPEAEARSFTQLSLPTDLTPERLRDTFARVGTLSVWALPELIGALERAGLSAREQRSALHSELSLPVMLIAMLMIGAMLSMRHSRTGRTGARVLITVLAGFALFFARNFALVLGENGQIPLWLAVWTPPFASILLATGLLLHLEDG
ncbi:MAG: LPS export ABC transporter permease LptG [Pararhodobacter sp.]|nr:LPS export ABC transporter permease LptG [Pararhodobacter sp.]